MASKLFEGLFSFRVPPAAPPKRKKATSRADVIKKAQADLRKVRSDLEATADEFDRGELSLADLCPDD